MFYDLYGKGLLTMTLSKVSVNGIASGSSRRRRRHDFGTKDREPLYVAELWLHCGGICMSHC